MRSLCLISSVVTAALLSACASGYSKFYKPADGASPERIAELRAAPPTGNISVDHIGNVDGDVIDAYHRNSYVVIGQSSFWSERSETEADAVAQAKKVGADRVLMIDPKYRGSRTASVPFTTPTSSTSHTTANATAYGAGGTVNAYGNSTTTTYGSQTTYIPITRHSSDYGAVYFVKRKYSFGANYRDLNDEERQQLQSNQGTVLALIVNDTPAFRADFLVGDIVLAVDGEPVYNSAELNRLIEARLGKSSSLTIVRNGQRISKPITFGTL